FAMYFGPLHFLLVREIIRALDARVPSGMTLVDLGCGTGVAGAAWATSALLTSKVIGIDRHPWVLGECKCTYRELGVQGATKSADVATVKLPQRTAVIAAFTINELDPAVRERFRNRFLTNAR